MFHRLVDSSSSPSVCVCERVRERKEEVLDDDCLLLIQFNYCSCINFCIFEYARGSFTPHKYDGHLSRSDFAGIFLTKCPWD